MPSKEATQIKEAERFGPAKHVLKGVVEGALAGAAITPAYQILMGESRGIAFKQLLKTAIKAGAVLGGLRSTYDIARHTINALVEQQKQSRQDRKEQKWDRPHHISKVASGPVVSEFTLWLGVDPEDKDSEEMTIHDENSEIEAIRHYLRMVNGLHFLRITGKRVHVRSSIRKPFSGLLNVHNHKTGKIDTFTLVVEND